MMLATLLVAGTAIGCSKEESPSKPAASASAAASAVPPSVSAPVPAATASAPAVVHPCPKDSTGPGTFTKPCEAKGATRLMDVAWTGKTDDKGPHFRVTNKSTLPILYGKIAVYFYDKAGKQLEVPDGAKPKPFQQCSGGNLFSGSMKAGEKAVLTFSCVEKKHVPEGTAAIGAEMQMVGFADATEKKINFYWSNNDLAPDARPKAGIK